MPLSKDAMREYQRRRRMLGERRMGCGKAAAEKYHRVNPIRPGLKLRAGCADALTPAAAANPASTGMCAICGIQPAMPNAERERLYRRMLPPQQNSTEPADAPLPPPIW